MIFIGALAGCAGSATHQVVTAHQSDDELLSCPQIDTEIIKAQVIIDGKDLGEELIAKLKEGEIKTKVL